MENSPFLILVKILYLLFWIFLFGIIGFWLGATIVGTFFESVTLWNFTGYEVGGIFGFPFGIVLGIIGSFTFLKWPVKK